MSYHYELNCGQPVLFRDGVPVSRPLDKLALSFDDSSEDGLITPYRHGDPAIVHAWVAAQKARSAASGSLEGSLAERLQVIELNSFPPGNFPLELVNQAIKGNQLALAKLVRPQDTIEVEARVIAVSERVEAPRG